MASVAWLHVAPVKGMALVERGRDRAHVERGGGEPALLPRRRGRAALRRAARRAAAGDPAAVESRRGRAGARVSGRDGGRGRGAARRRGRHGSLRPARPDSPRGRALERRAVVVCRPAAPARARRPAERERGPRPRAGDARLASVGGRACAAGRSRGGGPAPVPDADRPRRLRGARGGRVDRPPGSRRRSRRPAAGAGRALRHHDAGSGDWRSRTSTRCAS